MQLIECIPNFSEGQNPETLAAIEKAITSVKNIQLLHIDAGEAANRTVFTFVGPPKAVVEAAFLAIQSASKHIDMNKHKGEHPRIGATDVCPFVPLSNITMEETVESAILLAKRVGNELQIPVYLYENATQNPRRKNLAHIRKGEYEGLTKKLKTPDWIPDYGPKEGHPSAGATVIGARPFLIAYNVNLNSKSVEFATYIAQDIRESGRIARTGHRLYGPIVRLPKGKAAYIPGSCKSLKAIGWYIEEYGKAQVSMNLTNIEHTNMHEAFEACKKNAAEYGVEITGSELIGLAPLSCFLAAGRFYAEKNSLRINKERDLVQLAIQSLGLDDLKPFEPKEKIIEYILST